jgi:hypothetical protein
MASVMASGGGVGTRLIDGLEAYSTSPMTATRKRRLR